MKLLIGGKSRNIYMRKDGSAYYKSGGQQVDVTYMFKKKGGGLKKKYIKGGVGSEASTFDPNEVFQNISPQTKTKAPSKEAPAPAGAATVAPSAAQSAALQKLADEVPLPETSCYPRSSLTAQDLLPADLDATNSKWASMNPTTGGAIEDQNLLTAGWTVDAVPLLAAKTASALADTPPPKAETGSGTELEVLTDITALDNFPSNDNKEKFLKAFFDLAQLVISVTNNLCRKHNATIEIKTPNPETAEKQVTKLNGIINFILKSRILPDYKGGEGMLSPNFKLKKDYSEYQTEYLELFEDANTKFSIKKTNSLGLNHLATIFDIIGYVASLYTDNHTEDIKQFKIRICNNINSFLNNESKFKQIKANRLLDV